MGYVLGKRAKLRELHRLQQEGMLTITYAKHDAMKQMLYGDEPSDADEALDLVAYPRKSKDEDRNIDWAKTLRRGGPRSS